MDTSANKSVYEARTLGAEQYSSYKEGVFVLGIKSIYETIKRNKLSLYKNTNTVVISKTQKKVVSLKQDCQLYSSCMLDVKIVKEIYKNSLLMKIMLTLHHCQFMVKCVQPISQIRSRYLKSLLGHQVSNQISPQKY